MKYSTIVLAWILVANMIFGRANIVAAEAIDKPPRVEVDGNIKWVYDYTEGQLLSHASGKPMFVVFRCER